MTIIAADNLFALGALLFSIAANTVLGKAMAAAGGGSRRLWLVLALTVNLAVLGFFKYAGFVVDSLNVLLAQLGIPTLDPVSVHLPLGIGRPGGKQTKDCHV